MSQTAEAEVATRALEAEITPRDDGWDIRVPLRREVISVEKRVFVAEEVRIQRRQQTDTQRVQATLHRERLRVDTFGEADPPELTVRRER
jgi:uncharacterized protein (TIGR02271 family)